MKKIGVKKEKILVQKNVGHPELRSTGSMVGYYSGGPRDGPFRGL